MLIKDIGDSITSKSTLGFLKFVNEYINNNSKPTDIITQTYNDLKEAFEVMNKGEAISFRRAIEYDVPFTIINTENGLKWQHKTFNIGVDKFMKDATHFLRICEDIEKSIARNEKIKTLLYFVPIEYRNEMTQKVLADFSSRDSDWIRSNIEYTNKQKPKTYVGFLRYALKNDLAKDTRQHEQQLNEIAENYEKIKKSKQENIDKVNKEFAEAEAREDYKELKAKCIETYLTRFPKNEFTQMVLNNNMAINGMIINYLETGFFLTEVSTNEIKH